jgi:hypothetical protein
MKTREELEHQLIENRLMKTDEEIDLFEEAMNELYKEDVLENISIFCKSFDDNTEAHEVMFGLIHGIERYYKIFGEDVYIISLIDSLPKMNSNSIEWQDTLFYRILNSEWSRESLILKMNSLKLNDTNLYNIVINILNRIKNEDEKKFGLKISEILKRINFKDFPDKEEPQKPNKPRGGWSVFD